jgi:hypothetical protein
MDTLFQPTNRVDTYVCLCVLQGQSCLDMSVLAIAPKKIIHRQSNISLVVTSASNN